jgi:hypothetical protein
MVRRGHAAIVFSLLMGVTELAVELAFDAAFSRPDKRETWTTARAPSLTPTSSKSEPTTKPVPIKLKQKGTQS